MSTIERKYVIPGDTIIEGDYRPLINAIKRDNRVISTRIGMAEIVRKEVISGQEMVLCVCQQGQEAEVGDHGM